MYWSAHTLKMSERRVHWSPTEHCIMGTYAKRMCLVHVMNDFSRSCRDEGDEVIVLHLFGTYLAVEELSRWLRENLHELSAIDMGSLNCIIRSSEWFCGITSLSVSASKFYSVGCYSYPPIYYNTMFIFRKFKADT